MAPAATVSNTRVGQTPPNVSFRGTRLSPMHWRQDRLLAGSGRLLSIPSFTVIQA